MNLHPIIVHFPVALLSLYGVLELLRFRKLQAQPYFFHIKGTFLIFGSLFSFLALVTGEAAEKAITNDETRALVEKHSFFGTLSAYVFGFLALVYLISWISRTDFGMNIKSRFWIEASALAGKIRASFLVILLACIGLISITITGALGASIVYGPTIDPAVQFIYNLVL